MKNQLNKLHIFFKIMILCTTISSCNAQKEVYFNQGVYEGNFKLYNYENMVSGYLHDETGPGCELIFWGESNSKKIDISILSPLYEEIVRGTLNVVDKKITIKSDEFIMPCQNTVDLLKGWTYEFSKKLECEDCYTDFVNVDKSYIYSLNDEKHKSKSYFIKYDLLTIIKKNDDWALVKKMSDDNKTYWIKLRDLYGTLR